MNKLSFVSDLRYSMRPKKSRFFGKLKELPPRLRAILRRKPQASAMEQLELPLSD